ncbi:endonuclease NucS domain-containing protein [Salinibaculum rarum]|uniref:endonuclease NucS domain-containing protein n=1 Tax=Salinibaculum rarum TaxID=3058903 RepID=UPI00265E5EBF|nr:endonuclease NucS domain-containing protein [Salinibaculum sp. KK48]
MPDCTHVIAGTCTTTFTGDRDRHQHGDVLVVIKPDGTTLVHDAAGYQPVAWLTRPESVTVGQERVTASDGDQKLTIDIHRAHTRGRYPTTDAGVPVGDCPDCDGRLVRTRGAVSCPECDRRYGLPADATVTDETCDCGLPRLRVERGASFVVCLDRACESLDERVRKAFDREWTCPECGGDLRVLRRGGLILGCEQYPDCETGFAFPSGVHDGECECGLPAFETGSGRRCLDSNCGHLAEQATSAP